MKHVTTVIEQEHGLAPAKVGMLAFLLSEVAFFGTLIMTYVYFLHQSLQEALTPSQVFQLPKALIASACLFSSSGTIHYAERAIRRQARGEFMALWGATIALGVLFLIGTALEWQDLIVNRGLTIGSGLFGTTYFTLVGFHALHVTIGLIVMSIVLALVSSNRMGTNELTTIEVVSWYWHFVDGVWLVVFTVVYVVGR